MNFNLIRSNLLCLKQCQAAFNYYKAACSVTGNLLRPVCKLHYSQTPAYEDLVQDPLSLNKYFKKDSFEQRRINKLFQGLCKDKRACLAESITLVESRNVTKRMMGQVLLQLILNYIKNSDKKSRLSSFLNQYVKSKRKFENSSTMRIGITGPPGAGKSTFIESFGMFLTKEIGLKVAVLAVDPSSKRTGGSLLGDKTRMSKLSVEPMAYVRPSPSMGELGGVARNTMEALLLCEGAGYDIVIVETVGVGQSEVAVSDMTDIFILIIPPAGGDELQGLKRGIIENCDFVLVNKADGNLLPAARKIQTEYTSALKFIPRKYKNWRPRVRRVSSLQGAGIPDLWDLILDFYKELFESGKIEDNRKAQRNVWMWNHIRSNVLSRFKEDISINKKLPLIQDLVENEDITPGLASDLLTDSFFDRSID